MVTLHGKHCNRGTLTTTKTPLRISTRYKLLSKIIHNNWVRGISNENNHQNALLLRIIPDPIFSAAISWIYSLQIVIS